MTDKVQKIRAFLVGIADADGVSTILAKAIEKKILPYIDSLQEESLNEDFEMALTEMISNAQKCVVEPIVVAQQWKDYLVGLAKKEEPVSEELEKIVEEITEPTVLNAYGTKELARRLRNTVIYGTSVSEELDEVAELYTLDDSIKPWRNLTKEAFKAGANWQKLQDMGITNKAQDVVANLLSSADNPLDAYATEVAFVMLPATLKESYHHTNRDRIGDAVKLGAKWKENHLWKPADGDDLPDIDREVIALLDNGEVMFAHRPHKGKYIGKSLTTGNIETFENETYDKGGWNIPNVKYWLDVELPKK